MRSDKCSNCNYLVENWADNMAQCEDGKPRCRECYPTYVLAKIRAWFGEAASVGFLRVGTHTLPQRSQAAAKKRASA